MVTPAARLPRKPWQRFERAAGTLGRRGELARAWESWQAPEQINRPRVGHSKGGTMILYWLLYLLSIMAELEYPGWPAPDGGWISWPPIP